MSWLNPQVQLQRPSPSSPAWPRRNTLWPPQRQPSSPAILYRSLTHSSLAMKPKEPMGARDTDVSPPQHHATPFNPHKLEGRTQIAGGGRCCGWTPGSFFPSLFHLSLSLCQSRCPFLPCLLGLPPFCCHFFSHTRSQIYSWQTSLL